MKRSHAAPWLLALTAIAAAPFAGQTLAPDSALFRSLLSPAVLLWIGGTAKLFFLCLATYLAWGNTAAFDRATNSHAGWRRLSLGLGGFALGQAGLVIQQLSRNQTVFFPSPSDILFLLAYPLFIAALLAFLRAYVESGHPIGSAAERRWIGMATLAACLVLALPLLRPVMVSDAPAEEKALNAAYLLLDFALLVPTAVLLRIAFRFPGGAVGRIWTALMAGFLLVCAGDILFAYYTALEMPRLEPLLHVAYLASYGSLALGTAYQREVLR